MRGSSNQFDSPYLVTSTGNHTQSKKSFRLRILCGSVFSLIQSLYLGRISSLSIYGSWLPRPNQPRSMQDALSPVPPSSSMATAGRLRRWQALWSSSPARLAARCLCIGEDEGLHGETEAADSSCRLNSRGSDDHGIGGVGMNQFYESAFLRYPNRQRAQL